MVTALNLRDDEIAHLAESDRCESCDHLTALLNYHCCSFCTVCDCEL